jgi:hypothetical protein
MCGIMQIIFPIVFLLAALKWGKWKKWREYYPTILFMVLGNLLYSYLFKEYPLWMFDHTFEEKLLPTQMSINLIKSFTSFPILTLIFLSHIPEGKNTKKNIFYIIAWTILFIGIEYIARLLGMITYHNGWNMWWSMLFDFIMFVLLAMHYRNPILAWILSGIFIIVMWILFDISFELLD